MYTLRKSNTRRKGNNTILNTFVCFSRLHAYCYSTYRWIVQNNNTLISCDMLRCGNNRYEYHEWCIKYICNRIANEYIDKFLHSYTQKSVDKFLISYKYIYIYIYIYINLSFVLTYQYYRRLNKKIHLGCKCFRKISVWIIHNNFLYFKTRSNYSVLWTLCTYHRTYEKERNITAYRISIVYL